MSVSVLSVPELTYVHIKKVHRALSRRRAGRMQQNAMLVERQKLEKVPIMCTEEGLVL